MKYRAVGNRCAVDINSLNLPLPDTEVLAILVSQGFTVLKIDLISLARECIATSKYRRGAKPSEAPLIVDCSSFIKWLYGQRGIWLPRRSIQQRELGDPVPINEMSKDDIIFVSGWIDYYFDNPLEGVGHVGIATGAGTVIHASNSTVNIIESPLEDFAPPNKFRGARRYIPKKQNILTLETPTNREIEIDDDMRWIVLQSLPYK